jgi:hypothetical protein
MTILKTKAICALIILGEATKVICFAPGNIKASNHLLIHTPSTSAVQTITINSRLNARDQKQKDSKIGEPFKNEISEKRKKQLGIVDEREYDLGVALATNTDPLITKLIAGSFILVVIGLLIAGIVLPSLTDYGEGVCNPIRSAGRC